MLQKEQPKTGSDRRKGYYVVMITEANQPLAEVCRRLIQAGGRGCTSGSNILNVPIEARDGVRQPSTLDKPCRSSRT